VDLYLKIGEILKRNISDIDQIAKEKIVEELHIYHEELFFQNEELKRLNVQMSELNDEFLTLFNQAPLSYLYIDSEGVIQKSNNHFSVHFGIQNKNERIYRWIFEEDQDAFHQFFKEVRSGMIFLTTTIRLKSVNGIRYMKISANKVNIPEKLFYLISLMDVTEERLFLEEVRVLTFKDALTGLNNRLYFNEEIHRLNIERNLPLGIISLDVNGLKLINDSFGHDYGDRLLKLVADTLRHLCRHDEIISRIGGDEFIILIHNIDLNDLDRLYKRLQNGTSCLEINGISCSIAIGYGYKKDLETPILDVMKEAEKMMYRNKLYMNSTQNKNIINGILASLHEKHPREESHSCRVSYLMEMMAKHMKLHENQIIHFRTLGLLHDIGKIGIDYAILDKKDTLEDFEITELRRHAEIGFRILQSVKIFNDILEHVLSHHERIDGKGYPRGLSDHQISLEAKVLMICDTYDAITSDRPYRKARSKKDALAEMKRHAGTQFDVNLLDVFCEVMEIEK